MDEAKLQELMGQKFHCSQILMMTGMEYLEKDDPDLIRAMTGLAGGLAGCGRNCGALTGGAAMLGLFAGRGAPDEEENPELFQMVSEYLAWFEERFGTPDCDTILKGDKSNIPRTCPGLIEEACEKATEILRDYGYLPM